jgi:hypothetical protein
VSLPDQQGVAALSARSRSRIATLALDGFVLVSVVLLSVSLYIADLGFYSDDWSFLAMMNGIGQHSFAKIVDVQFLNPNLAGRPLQVAYQAVLFWLFGLDPLGYHITNAVVFTITTVLFYLVLRELGVSRSIAVAVPAVFALMPSYSTDRLWFAAFGYTLTLALYFLSLYADLRAVRSNTRTLVAWKFLALMALVASGLGYEIVLPLFALNMLIVWKRASATWPGGLVGRLGIIGAGSYVVLHYLLLSVVTSYKWITAEGLGVGGSYRFHLARLLFGSLATDFGTYGIALPQAAWWGIRSANIASLLVGAALGLGMFAYMMCLTAERRGTPPESAFWLRLAGVGLVVYVLGHAIFLTTYRFGSSSSGIANRTNIGGAPGAALLLVGLVGWLASHARHGRPRRLAFSSTIAALCMSALLIMSGLASFWGRAWSQQQSILLDIRSGADTLPSGGTLILNGTCPYVGPAIVFESPWDLTGALRIAYADPTLRGDVSTPRLTIEPDGIRTTIYGHEGGFYPFDGRLFLFDRRLDLLLPIVDAQTIRAYLAEHPMHCPLGEPGRGVTVFPLDELYERWEARGFRP